MTPHEAVACGTVPVCFDMNGPWELIQQGLQRRGSAEIKPELMARELINLYTQPGRLNSCEPTLSPYFARARPWNHAGRRSANFFNCRKIHENALACRPSAGQRTRTSCQLQWLHRGFRKARRIGCANPLRPGVRR